MAFQAEQKPINHLLTNNVLGIPRNQRSYVWRKENWEDLLSDLNFIVKNNEEKNHFIGSIVLKEEEPINGLNKYTIIDGQQRTITILLFLSVILKIFQEEKMEKDFLGTVQYLISRDRKSNEYSVLDSEEHLFLRDFIAKIVLYDNQDNIATIINKCIVDKTKEKNLIECVAFFYDSIRQEMHENEEPYKYIVALKDAVLDTNYVRITADTEEDSYTIFEILNARGLSLAEHELLKNYIMRYILPKNQVDSVKKKWEQMEKSLGATINRFFKHYATHKVKANNKGSVYRTIQKAYSKEQVSILFDDILLKHRYYHIIISPECEGEDRNCTELEYKIFKFFKQNRAEQFRPILMSLMSQKEKGNLSESRYKEVLRFIYSFFVCYNIIGEEKSNKLEETIYKYAPMIENEYSEKNLSDFIDSLRGKIPNLKTFKERFKTLGFSNHYDFYKDSKNKNRVVCVLEVIEEYLSKTDFVNDFTIEHILPDSQDQSHSLIGNLIPLEKALNEKCKDKTIRDKFVYYSQSNYKMARRIPELYEKKDFDINSRTDYLAQFIYIDILHLNGAA